MTYPIRLYPYGTAKKCVNRVEIGVLGCPITNDDPIGTLVILGGNEHENWLYPRQHRGTEHSPQEVLTQELGVDEIYIDKASGKNTDRPQLKMMLSYVRHHDTVIVESISRFARNTRDTEIYGCS